MWQHVQGVVASISKSNALYPLLIALTLSVFFAGAVIFYIDSVVIQLAVLLLPASVVFQIVRSYDFFMKNNPDMLRTETHVIQKHALAALGDETHGFNASAADVIAIVNPQNPIKREDEIEPPKDIRLLE